LAREGSRTERDAGTGPPRSPGSRVREDPVDLVPLGGAGADAADAAKADNALSPETKVDAGTPLPSPSTHLADEVHRVKLEGGAP
jgi:hypothetical protein